VSLITKQTAGFPNDLSKSMIKTKISPSRKGYMEMVSQYKNM